MFSFVQCDKKSFSFLCAYVELIPRETSTSSAKVEVNDTATAAIVPPSPDLILPVVDDIVDRFWDCRRYGESWDSSNPPSGFFDDCGSGPGIETETRRVHRRLVFDLAAEIITETYRSEEDDRSYCPDACFVPKPAAVRQKPEPPTTLDSLKPRVEAEVLRRLKLRDVVPLSVPKWSSRRKQDMVDLLLVKELSEEEPGWVDYTAAEWDVRTQLVDALMEMLLNDTVQTVQQAIRFRQITAD